MKTNHRYLKSSRRPLLPAWLFLTLMAAYQECMVHIWVTDEIQPGRFLAVLTFGLGLGAALGLLVSFIPSPKGQKWTAVGVSLVMSVFWLMETFIFDSYKVFMDLTTIVGGAGGVATDFMDEVINSLTRNVGSIFLMLLPTVVYAVFFRSGKTKWLTRGFLTLAAASLYVLGLFVIVPRYTPDGGLLGNAYNFDSAAQSFGLHMGLILDATHGSPKDAGFVTVETEPTVPPTTEAAEPEEVTQETEPEIVYEDQVIPGVDFAELAAANRGPIASIYSYAASQTPAKKNAYTGLFKGKNLILITAEAFTKETIDPELTPALYRMATKGIQFQEYYQPAWGASTTAGEFSNLIGLVPTSLGACMKEAKQQKLLFTMGYQLGREGTYYSAAYHNHLHDFYERNETHTKLGYDQFLARGRGLDDYITPVFPESDLELIDATIPECIANQPFNVYYMTVSGHCPYSLKENAQARRHMDQVKSFYEKKGVAHSDTVMGYLASQQELELAMESLLKQLEEAGIADDTVVVLATDHYPYGLERSKTWQNTRDHLAELFGVEDYDLFMRDHNALIIWSGCLEDQNIVVDEPVYSLDILPTLSNLFGVEYDSRLLIGRDVFSDQSPLVLWPDHSWITDKGRYNSRQGTFTPTGDETVTQEYIDQISAIVSNKITYSRSVIEQNFFNYLAKDLGRE